MDIAKRGTVERLFQFDNFIVLLDAMRFQRHYTLRIFSVCGLHVFQFNLRLHYPCRHCVNLILILKTGCCKLVVLLYKVYVFFFEAVNFRPKIIIRLQLTCFRWWC